MSCKHCEDGFDCEACGQLMVPATQYKKLKQALNKIAKDDGIWSDGNGPRASGPGFARVQQIAIDALDENKNG